MMNKNKNLAPGEIGDMLAVLWTGVGGYRFLQCELIEITEDEFVVHDPQDREGHRYRFGRKVAYRPTQTGGVRFWPLWWGVGDCDVYQLMKVADAEAFLDTEKEARSMIRGRKARPGRPAAEVDVLKCLISAGGDVGAAAKLAGLARSGIYRHMKTQEVEVVRLPVSAATAKAISSNMEGAGECLEEWATAMRTVQTLPASKLSKDSAPKASTTKAKPSKDSVPSKRSSLRSASLSPAKRSRTSKPKTKATATKAKPKATASKLSKDSAPTKATATKASSRP